MYVYVEITNENLESLTKVWDVSVLGSFLLIQFKSTIHVNPGHNLGNYTILNPRRYICRETIPNRLSLENGFRPSGPSTWPSPWGRQCCSCTHLRHWRKGPDLGAAPRTTRACEIGRKCVGCWIHKYPWCRGRVVNLEKHAYVGLLRDDG